MKKSTLISIILFTLTSCQQELVYNPFITSDKGMTRYLSRIEETSIYSQGSSQNATTSVLFSNPSYDLNGKIITTYNNISGYDANFIYSYFEDEIELIANCKNGKIINRKYYIKHNYIISCTESSNLNPFIRIYQYDYDSSYRLEHINIYDEEYDFRSDINIEWTDGNITTVNVILENGYTSKYEFKYASGYNCYPGIPCFFSTCYEIGGVYGIDELLSMQNYFGISISKNLPDEIFYNGKISQEFEYEFGNNGCVNKVHQVDTERKRIYRTYTFKWN